VPGDDEAALGISVAHLLLAHDLVPFVCGRRPVSGKNVANPMALPAHPAAAFTRIELEIETALPMVAHDAVSVSP
jgi:hypothetical protein